MKTIKSLRLEKPVEGRRFAISDIHGCSESFKALLKQINLTKEDQLFLVGDLVNRGPRTHKVLNKLLKLKKEGYQLFFIRGNHEQTILNTVKKSEGQRRRVLRACNAHQLLEGGKIIPSYVQLLKNSYHFIELDHFYLVHAGFNFKSPTPFEDTHSMLNIRSFKAKRKYLSNKKIIVGHQPKNLSTIIKRLKKGKRKIYIDNGCVNFKTEDQGSLLCLNMDTLTISLQRNIDN